MSKRAFVFSYEMEPVYYVNINGVVVKVDDVLDYLRDIEGCYYPKYICNQFYDKKIDEYFVKVEVTKKVKSGHERGCGPNCRAFLGNLERRYYRYHKYRD